MAYQPCTDEYIHITEAVADLAFVFAPCLTYLLTFFNFLHYEAGRRLNWGFWEPPVSILATSGSALKLFI